MDTNVATPDYLFESSWEVCNKVGGIYTVLSTKAYTLHQKLHDRVIFIGPDVWADKAAPDFKEDPSLFADWKQHAEAEEGLKIKVGRWEVPGNPPAILVDFKPFSAVRDTFFFSMWENFHVDSIHAYGDYDESCIFALATGHLIESFYRFYGLENKKVVALFNEWMLGMGALYLRKRLPAVATIFTTHATSIGRSIAGNNKPLYAYLDQYNGDQMAAELNMEAKHSVEKQTAHFADCFTTVSDITARECNRLLDRAPDIVTPNGFEPNFVPAAGKSYNSKRKEARRALIDVTEKLLGCKISPDALLVSTSGRYEYRNKGIDVFIEAMNRLRVSNDLTREVVAFIMVPAWVRDARADLKAAIDRDFNNGAPLQFPFITHWLNNMQDDRVLNYLAYSGFTNAATEKLKIVFVPCYLSGNDGIFNKPYYDLLIGMDATVYPSYYEPWGYTPLESVAFGIPTITTNLAGFGLWSLKYLSGSNIKEGVTVIDRTDFNYFEVADSIRDTLLTLTGVTPKEAAAIQKNCFNLAKQAEWEKFIWYYERAFDVALKRAEKRNN